MDKLTVVVALLLALGAWLHSGIGGRGRQAIPGVAAASTPEPAETAAISEPALDVVRGREGFWRVARDRDGVWWFLSPADQLEFLNTVTTVQPVLLSRDADGAMFVSRDWDGDASDRGNVHAWAERTLARVRAAGFKGLGAWCNPVFHELDVPMTRDLNIWAWMPPDESRLYSPGWADKAERAVREQVVALRDNRNLVGYFIDNEIDWGDGFAGPARYFDHLPPDNPNRVEVTRVIRKIWPDIETFNHDWGTDLPDWSALNDMTALPHPRVAYRTLFSAWLSHLAEDYFRTTCTLIRKYDPNHLILGVRFRGYAPREVVRASREWTDVQSINYYVADARLDAGMFQMMHEESGQPIMIGEYSFHALDGRSGNRNTVGFAAQVPDQRARADGYREMTTRLARVPYVVGAEWFQWMDEPPGGRSLDGEDVNFGIVDVDDREYELLVDAVRQTTPLLNSLHAASMAEESQDVWRPSYADRPIARIPHLDQPIRLNGELSDWPSDARLPGVRHAPTIGAERSELPAPDIYVGWREDGLYLAFEVFDDDIRGAPAGGWWWTRDHVEFWVSTRPISPGQDAYDRHSHQFFFVPIDAPGEDGRLGAVGQWHRPGDALTGHLIPHPQIRHAARILPRRYVVEIFIPAEALNGFDPQKNPAMAFNVHVRDFERAGEYFWSAPKDVMTHLRPGTWGSVVLSPSASPALADLD